MIVLEKVTKVFPTGVAGLSDISLAIEKGEFAFITGTTGSGKTTLLKVIIREILPTEGNVIIEDVDVVKLPKKRIPHFRKRIGMIFQDLKLLPDRTILENVLLPMEIAGVSPKEAQLRAEELLEDVGLLEHKDKFPIQLSGGELQRVAIARALTLSPEIIIADEPTGNLDNETAMTIVELLHAIHRKGATILMVTHNNGIVEKYPDHRVIVLEKGKITKDTKGGAKSVEHKAKSKEEEKVSSDKFQVARSSEEHTEEKAKSGKAHAISSGTHPSTVGKTTSVAEELSSSDVFAGSIEEKIEKKKGKK